MKKLLNYFKGDELAANVWQGKYAQEGEETPDDMHKRLAREFSRVENKYIESESELETLSKYGQERKFLTEERIFELFKDFKYIIPQGSIMSQLGSKSIGSLSNCFVIGQPEDSYGGIFQKDEEMAQLMKRRGGVGLDISTLRPKDTSVSNAAKTTTGAVSFMHRYSNTTREVAQNGRRGALMLSIDVNHPDVMDFIKIKRDGTSVTGANISIKINDKFMKAVENDEDYILRFPCNITADITEDPDFDKLEYNKLETWSNCGVKKIKAKEYWDEIIKSAHGYAEPGIIFVDNHHDYSPDGAYPQFKGVTTNPCFHPDTQIDTEFGRLKIKDINKPMRVYSMDSDGRLVMASASASFISKYNAETLKINLKNGNSIQVTPEHKMYVHDKGWVEAKDLQLGDRIAHLCRSRRGAKYSGVHLTTSPNKQMDQVMEHKLVFGPHEADCNIHHLDRDTYNNSINNLELLTHSEHSRITALEDNPQTHQVKDERGQFISGENSRKGAKVIVDLPNDLKTNMLSRFHNCVESISKGETTDVYDIQVEDTNCLIANNMVAHNCGEIFMQPYDACRLIAVNLFSFVKNPFTVEAEFDIQKFYEVNYEAMRLSDDLIDLELEHIERILHKISQDKESSEVRAREYELWTKIKETAEASRRTGLGFTALGDCLAALGYKYDSEEALLFIEQIMHIKMEAELDCTIDLAILRGTFKGWDENIEYPDIQNSFKAGNEFYQMLESTFPVQCGRMQSYGRRNVSWNTVAPTGTVSLLTQTTSGIEPIFSLYPYIRRKKINPNDKNVRVDFVDESGDSWQEYAVIHPKLIDYMKLFNINISLDVNSKEEQEELVKITKEFLDTHTTPWDDSTANDIDWIKRVEIQSIIQKYTTHSISSTINLPNSVSEQEVSEIYLESWKKGLKGITVYRDGSRSGVLVSTTENKGRDEFNYVDAVKRPKELPAEVHTTKVGGKSYNVFVGLLNNKPYEVFIEEIINGVGIGNSYLKGIIKKKSKGIYNYSSYDKKGGLNIGISSGMTNEQSVITRLVSTSLRHGADIKFIVEQINKCDGDLFSFTKGLVRVLKKYIPDGAKSTMKCNSCGSENVIFEEGCSKCLNCGNSKCG